MACCHGTPWSSVRRVTLAALALAATILPTTASAQSASTTAPPGPDFLLGRPRASVGMRGQFVFAAAGSDIYDFVTDQLTLDKSNFNAPAIGGELGFAIAPRFDVVVGIEVAKSTTGSEYRHFIDNAGLPIVQTTSFKTFNLMASGKVALLPRGRSISRFAWIPRSMTPYVGAGGGFVRYEFSQLGDFVDYQTMGVFADSFHSDGWSPTVHAFGGVDVQVYRRLFVSIEGRYLWADAKLGSDFVDFAPIDLSGFRVGGGIHVVF